MKSLTIDIEELIGFRGWKKDNFCVNFCVKMIELTSTDDKPTPKSCCLECSTHPLQQISSTICDFMVFGCLCVSFVYLLTTGISLDKYSMVNSPTIFCVKTLCKSNHSKRKEL